LEALQFLHPVRHHLALEMPGVCSIPCECRNAFIGQIESRVKERHRHIRLKHAEKSCVAEHSRNLGHLIQLYNTSILAKKLRCMNQITREAIKIELHPNNINGEDGFFLSRSRKPFSHDIREHKLATNNNVMHADEPWKGLFSSLTSLRAHPPPCNLLKGSLLVHIHFPYFLPLIGSLP
jgi:hypothetical protein